MIANDDLSENVVIEIAGFNIKKEKILTLEVNLDYS